MFSPETARLPKPSRKISSIPGVGPRGPVSAKRPRGGARPLSAVPWARPACAERNYIGNHMKKPAGRQAGRQGIPVRVLGLASSGLPAPCDPVGATGPGLHSGFSARPSPAAPWSRLWSRNSGCGATKDGPEVGLGQWETHVPHRSEGHPRAGAGRQRQVLPA